MPPAKRGGIKFAPFPPSVRPADQRVSAGKSIHFHQIKLNDKRPLGRSVRERPVLGQRRDFGAGGGFDELAVGYLRPLLHKAFGWRIDPASPAGFPASPVASRAAFDGVGDSGGEGEIVDLQGGKKGQVGGVPKDRFVALKFEGGGRAQLFFNYPP